MNRQIYVDLDDIVCDTAREFARLLGDFSGRTVGFEEIVSFDLKASFGLSDADFTAFMRLAHEPHTLSRLKPVEGAIEALRSLRSRGWEIHIVTGRPPSTFVVSETWLRQNTVPHDYLTFVDKYSRHDPMDAQVTPLRLVDLARMEFTAAVEDSPDTVDYLSGHLNVPVALFDRPWNRTHSLDASASTLVARCDGWADVMDFIGHSH